MWKCGEKWELNQSSWRPALWYLFPPQRVAVPISSHIRVPAPPCREKDVDPEDADNLGAEQGWPGICMACPQQRQPREDQSEKVMLKKGMWPRDRSPLGLHLQLPAEEPGKPSPTRWLEDGSSGSYWGHWAPEAGQDAAEQRLAWQLYTLPV